MQINIAKKLFKVIACENCARQVRLLRFLLMQKFLKNQQKINFLQHWGHLKTLKFSINFCTILKVLRRSNFLLLLCSKRRTKVFFTPPCCSPAIEAIFDGQCHYTDYIERIWLNAKTFCEEGGSNLASIHSEEKNIFATGSHSVLIINFTKQ